MTPQDSVIIFFGDSQIEYCNWNELLGRTNIVNQGIAGDVVTDLLDRAAVVCQEQPTKIFIEIGTNDLSMNLPLSQIRADYEKLITILQQNCKAAIYVNSVLPLQDFPGEIYQNASILALNRSLKQLCTEKALIYIDLTDALSDDSGNLNPAFTMDGLHLNAEGYVVWANILTQYLV